MLGSLRRVCLFVGMIVGAGFATGRELALYFFRQGYVTLVLTGVDMGIAFALFLFVGRSGSYQYLKNTHIGRIMAIVMRLAVVVSFVVMVSGAEELMVSLTGWRYIGIITGMLTGILASRGIRGAESISLILVPLILLLVCVLHIDAPMYTARGLSLMRPLRYVGMNMLMGGYLILEEGDKVSTREIVLSSGIVAVVFALLLIMIMRAMGDFTRCTMPIYSLAESKGLGVVGAVLIYIAILTTLIGDALLIYDGATRLVPYRILVVLMICMLSIIALGVDFARAVDIVYNIEGFVGIIFVIYVLIGYIYCTHMGRAHHNDGIAHH